MKWTMTGAGEKKIGLLPAAVTGRVGYMRGSGKSRDFVVRDFAVDPGRLYLDAPRSGSGACAVQACSVSTEALGSFSELEYHAPGIGGETGTQSIDELSTVRFFRGPARLVEGLAAHVMGTAPASPSAKEIHP